MHFAWEYLCHRITPRANRRAHAGRTPNGCYVLNDRYSRNTLTRHTRQPVRPLAGRMTGSSGYPVRRSFAILSLALWNTWVARSSRAMTLCARVVIRPSGGLLTGLSSLISDFPKNISVPRHPKSDLELSPSHPTRGAYHDRHGRGEGCGGRGSVLRAMDGRAS